MRLTLFRIFGSTSRLAELCLKAPIAAAEALTDGPSSVIAGAARDLADLEGGVGGPEALHNALEPIKARVDLAVGIAEIAGAWTASEACAARAEFAERLVETSLKWLLRGGVNRGELSLDLSDGAPIGVFAVAGGDFAHEELSPYGPLDLAILYDQAMFKGQAASMAERAFVRLGAELKEVFEGKPGSTALFSLRTPLGGGVNGAGLVETIARVRNALDDSQQDGVRAFIGSSRIVAGDRTAGGAFLEDSEIAIWGASHAINKLLGDACDDDPCAGMRRLCDVLRFGLGRTRPLFRTAPANVFV